MAWTLVLLSFLSYFSGGTSQPTLTQPVSQSGSLGETIQLSCGVSGSRNNIGWIQQRSGQAPRFVHCDGCGNRGPGIPDRFTGTRSGNNGYLTISNLQSEDEADYYCSMWYSSGNVWIFGTGTQMTVGGQPTVSPTVRAFGPGQEGTEKKILACLLSNFYPPTFNLQWKVGGNPIESGVETSKATKQGDKYLASSYLSLPRSAYGKGNLYTCEVTHEGKTISKSVSDSGSC